MNNTILINLSISGVLAADMMRGAIGQTQNLRSEAAEPTKHAIGRNE
ncbi:hypothetical protein ACVIHI_005744 [Bradyrhizobium sp. USDA 4524]|nr:MULTISPECIES: hypothetical protein [Bradyrhizobium]MCP1841335.1 hypothetical protein [Bradyrhizobium sp. USDA 4538]MCP1901899.1 hypothetical protein [Bradyrhizobium sp. USDA 4537]MCP1992444.1 hypothetical protein [Bradyrhizobium sp. USDA 4539]MCP3419041.1 hypothetical protein [Bradyrhizobium brasilense]